MSGFNSWGNGFVVDLVVVIIIFILAIIWLWKP
jgi:hypothetical protein